MMAALDREIETKGKYVLISEDAVIGAFDSYQEAQTAGLERFGGFGVKPVLKPWSIKSPHWNDHIPGDWHTRRLDEVGSYIAKFCQPTSGVYRLVGLAEPGVSTPAILDRICGRDHTGTLYIGREGKNFVDRGRLSKLVRSLSNRRRGVYNSEHNAGYRLRLIS